MRERASIVLARWRPHDDDKIRTVEEAHLFHSIHEASLKSTSLVFHFAVSLEDCRMH